MRTRYVYVGRSPWTRPGLRPRHSVTRSALLVLVAMAAFVVIASIL